MTGEIVSAGIDIGTSTTHFTISRLTLSNSAAMNRVPKLTISQRQIIYQSPIFATPLNEDDTINAAAVASLLSSEYEKAGLTPSDIQTGAVIITGESARKRNARQVSLAISELSGDFVVASAGCQLESLLSGRGAGAEAASRSEAKTICNIDIGGGTSNYSVFRNGELIDSACLGIGGRCLQFTRQGNLKSFTESGEVFLAGVGKSEFFKVGSVPASDMLHLTGALLAEVVLHAATAPVAPPIVQNLLLTEPLQAGDYHVDEYWISGGIAECLRNPPQDMFEYGDFGVVLANELAASFEQRNLRMKISEHGIRATVIGAGSHSLQLSGCTVFVSKNALPLRNVPIIHPFLPGDDRLTEAEISNRLNQAYTTHLREELGHNFAIAICDLSKLAYEDLQKWARALCSTHLQNSSAAPLIVLSREDVGLALGQTIKMVSADIELLILDDIDTSVGDFVDIGNVFQGQNEVVPLTIKTLIFNG